MAFTAVAAIAGGAEVTASLALAAVSEVGIAMTVVGAVTGDKSLMQIGGVMGLVGGIGGLVAGAGADVAAGAAASDVGSLGSLGTDAASVGDATAMDAAAASDAGSLGSSQAIQSAPIDSPAGIVNRASAPAVQATPIAEPAQQPTLAQAPVAQTPQLAPSVQADPLSVKGATGPADLVGAQAPQGAQAAYTPFENGFPSAATAPTTSSNFFGSMMDFANKNQKLLAGGMQLLGGAMNGANQRDMFNQQLALNQQRLQQTSYGSQVANTTPRPGIVQGAMA